MDKEQILSTLKEKLGTTNLSDRSLSTYIENNLPGEGIEPDDTYWNRHTSVLKSFQGQFNADVSSQLSAQLESKIAKYYEENPDKIKDYLAKHPDLLKSSEKQEPGEDAKLTSLEKEISQLKADLAIQAKARAVDEMKARVVSMMKEKGLNVNQGIWEDSVKSAELKEGGNENDLYESAKAIYEARYKRYFGNGANPFKAATTSPFSAQDGDVAVKNFFAQKKAKMGKK